MGHFSDLLLPFNMNFYVVVGCFLALVLQFNGSEGVEWEITTETYTSSQCDQIGQEDTATGLDQCEQWCYLHINDGCTAFNFNAANKKCDLRKCPAKMDVDRPGSRNSGYQGYRMIQAMCAKRDVGRDIGFVPNTNWG